MLKILFTKTLSFVNFIDIKVAVYLGSFALGYCDTINNVMARSCQSVNLHTLFVGMLRPQKQLTNTDNFLQLPTTTLLRSERGSKML